MFTGKEFSNQSDQIYWAWSYKNLGMLDRENVISRTCFNAGFYLGAQYAMHTSAELSPHVARFLEFTMWLTEREVPTATRVDGYQEALPFAET